ncbi:hypothetical protein POM88_030729 [Heracleum sosnowskyi]|uniref:F-box domain-containing protein n=1 Tax=Heracleum sosnowskyi TaxID=360622 RepID=A0AAD8MIF0_9APIA|nr:hypothetical protein POM88_030729 [Heracleum sosnowskyi]
MVRDVKTRRLDCGNGAVDRISKLPSSLLTLILKRLPIRDVARTSILSKTWRGIWVMHPHLVFDEEFFKQFISKEVRRIPFSVVVKTISSILLLHTGPLLTFHLSIPKYLSLHQCLDTGFWISNILNNGVRNLEILNKQPVFYRMPSYIFSCVDLTYLKLVKCVLNPPLGFGGFCNLTDLVFVTVKITTDLSFGTRLKRIHLEDCTGIQHLGCLVKNNNDLIALTIFVSGEFDWRLFESIQKPQLLRLTLNGVANFRNEVINLDKLIGSMPRINYLDVDNLFLESLKPGAAVVERFITTLEDLYLANVGFHNLVRSQCVLCLIKISPNLQHLGIQLESKVNSSDDTDLMVLWVDIILDQLTTVEIKGIVGSRAEFQFIKLLLATTPSLGWIKLEKDKTINDPKEELRISRELLEFPRASTAAQITWT